MARNPLRDALPAPVRVEELVRSIAGQCLPPRPVRDGDCADVSARVTVELRALDVDAATVSLIGWDDQARRVIRYMHVITLVDGCAVDLTAQQYDRDLPAIWVAPLDEYLPALAAATGVEAVTVIKPTAR